MRDRTIQEIKHNCDISDAHFWGNFSICGLLMRYRDLYRSERGFEPWDPVKRDEIGPWIASKEAKWPELEKEGFHSIHLDDTLFDPFDAAGINRMLEPEGYIYGAGYGMYLKPTFFLAELLSSAWEEGHRVYTVGEELVRDLFSAPAMLLGSTIVLRNDPLKALLWDKYSVLKPGEDSTLARAFLAQGLRPQQPLDKDFASAMERMTASYRSMLLRHELAESAESALGWKDILIALDHRGAEHFVRAVQDLIADTSDSGPIKYATDHDDTPSLLLYAGLLEGYRRLLFPEMKEITTFLSEQCNWQTVDHIRRTAHAKFRELRRGILELRKQGDHATMIAGILELSRKAG